MKLYGAFIGINEYKDKRIHNLQLARHDALTVFETVDLMSSLQPRRLLILADALPVDTFWQSVPLDTDVQILAFEQTRERVDQLAEVSHAFRKFKDNVHWMVSLLDQVSQLWKFLREDPFPLETEAIITGNTPEEIFTGLYYARKEAIPLISARMVGTGGRPVINKVTIQNERNSVSESAGKMGDTLQSYEPINTAKLCDTPNFICMLEATSNLGFVATIIHTFEQRGQVVLNSAPTSEARNSAISYVKRISDLVLSESTDQVYQELKDLSQLVTEQIPQHIHELLQQYPDLPVQIVGKPFPYSLCSISKREQELYWAEAYNLAFLPLHLASRIYLRNSLPSSADKAVQMAPLSAIVDTLSVQGKTETQFVITNLQNVGSYCLNLSERNASIHTVKSLLKYLAVDICMFVTHGNESGLVLADDVLLSHEIPALDLPGHPFIINNSCLS